MSTLDANAEALAVFEELEVAIENLGTHDYDNGRRLLDFGFKRLSLMPEPEPTNWLIEGLWPDGSYGMWGGAEKSFKSYLTAYGALCIASGRPFFGRAVKQGKVIVFTGEGSAELFLKRAMKIASGMGLDLADADLLVSDMAGSSRNQDFLDVVSAASEEATLILIDPWYVYNGAADEPGNMFLQGRELAQLSSRAAGKCSLWLVHHFRKALREAADSPPTLQDLTQAGGREWVDSWMLISTKFDNNRKIANIKLFPGSRQSDDVVPVDNVQLDVNDGKATFSVVNAIDEAIARVASKENERIDLLTEKLDAAFAVLTENGRLKSSDLREAVSATNIVGWAEKMAADGRFSVSIEGKTKWVEIA